MLLWSVCGSGSMIGLVGCEQSLLYSFQLEVEHILVDNAVPREYNFTTNLSRICPSVERGRL